MRAPLSWLREYVDLPEHLDGRAVAERLIGYGLEVETVESAGGDVTGPVVIGRVLSKESEPQKNGKTINWCRVDVGAHNPSEGQGAPGNPEPGRGVVCGAHNFGVDDLVVVALPGSVLPGDFAIAARKTYGHVSDGMICSTSELGLGEDRSGGIIVLPTSTDDGRELVVGEPAGPVLCLTDEVLDIAVTPNMGYCLSIRGIAREAAESTQSAFTDPVAAAVPEPSDAGYPVRLESAACPLFVAVSVTGIDPSRPSPQWLKRRLQLCGMRSISLIVDITNYVMLETGQPLHAYDADRLTGPIVVRQARAGERLTTLDDAERVLDEADLVITDDSGVIGIAGVMGGAATEINDETTTIVIEAAHFDALSIARSSRRHRLGSEASRRFEREVDPGASYAAAHRVADLLVELAGGTVAGAETIAGAPPQAPSREIAADLPERILGTPVSPDRAVELLAAGGSCVERALTPGGAERLRITPPSWRPDLSDAYDFVEEIGRKIGFDTIEPILPVAPPGRGLTRSQRARRAISNDLAASGFVEIVSFPFLASSELDRLGVEAEDSRRRLVRLANPLAETAPFLRTTLVPGLLAAAAKNLSRGTGDLALFELAAVFYAREAARPPRPSVAHRPSESELAGLEAVLPDQPRHLAVLLSGEWRPAGWQGSAEPAGWAQALAAADVAAAAVGLSLVREAVELAPWHPGRCASLSVVERSGASVLIGYGGELHPSVCTEFGLPPRSAVLELDLDALIAAAPVGGNVVAISGFPLAKEDVALVVDDAVSADDVRRALVEGAGGLLEAIRLFDLYVGEQAGVGKKSLAFALRFRAADRTLTDAEAAAARDAAVAVAVERFGARLRSI